MEAIIIAVIVIAGVVFLAKRKGKGSDAPDAGDSSSGVGDAGGDAGGE